MPVVSSGGRMQRATARAATVVLAACLCLCVTCALGAAPHFGWSSCDPSVVQSSGYIDIPGINNTQKHYFYWLFGPRRRPTDGSQPPVIMWMTGGPGCSSGLALANELGPCLMNETSGNLYHNAYGWNDEAYLLFVDQPTGVGYSYGDKANYDHNESEVAEDMYNFLQGFARQFPSPSITGANDFYVMGENYGGHYVPSVGYRILVGNQRGDGPHINLKGIAVGNGWTDPYTQAPSNAEVAYNWCKEKLGVPCVNESVHEEMLSLVPEYQRQISDCNNASLGVDQMNAACVQAGTVCETYDGYYFATGHNTHNIREPCRGSLCYPINHMVAFFNSPDVRASLGVSDAPQWSICSFSVWELFENDFMKNFNWTIPPLLDAGVRVMIYAGDMDYICNWMGNKAWVTALNWPGKAAFNAAPDVEFSVAGAAAGQERTYGNFSFVRIYDAGQMVPMDQPAAALYMVHRFLHDEPLAGRLPSGH